MTSGKSMLLEAARIVDERRAAYGNPAASMAAIAARWSVTLGIPVTVPRIKEATALGAAILAGVGAGVYGNISDTVQRLCTLEKTYEPNLQNHEVYLELNERWKTVYRNQLALAYEGDSENLSKKLRTSKSVEEVFRSREKYLWLITVFCFWMNCPNLRGQCWK